jgi:ubiquinone/menaquinone biosynthesis C-methylase UbiE
LNETYKNYFTPKTVAERYAKGRPHFHCFVIEKIKKFLALKQNLSFVLDVGCGTGLSSAALKTISERIVGIDVSFEMMRQAAKTPGIEYFQASAENLPFGEAKFDLITISQAIHWINKQNFFAEADRVLKRGSIIVAYDNYFQGQMLGNPAFNDWYNAEFLKNYPVPARGRRAFDETSENPLDFVLEHEEFNENTLEFSATEMVNYLITVSNVIARVENGGQPIREVCDRLTEGIEPFFNGRRQRFVFINPIWYLRRNS